MECSLLSRPHKCPLQEGQAVVQSCRKNSEVSCIFYNTSQRLHGSEFGLRLVAKLRPRNLAGRPGRNSRPPLAWVQGPEVLPKPFGLFRGRLREAIVTPPSSMASSEVFYPQVRSRVDHIAWPFAIDVPPVTPEHFVLCRRYLDIYTAFHAIRITQPCPDL